MELFFKQHKQTLKLSDFPGYSDAFAMINAFPPLRTAMW